MEGQDGGSAGPYNPLLRHNTNPPTFPLRPLPALRFLSCQPFDSRFRDQTAYGGEGFIESLSVCYQFFSFFLSFCSFFLFLTAFVIDGSFVFV